MLTDHRWHSSIHQLRRTMRYNLRRPTSDLRHDHRWHSSIHQLRLHRCISWPQYLRGLRHGESRDTTGEASVRVWCRWYSTQLDWIISFLQIFFVRVSQSLALVTQASSVLPWHLPQTWWQFSYDKFAGDLRQYPEFCIISRRYLFYISWY